MRRLRSTSLDRCNNVDDLRKLARRRLPWAIYNFLEGGADDEATLRRNTAAFADYDLVPDALVDVATLDTRARVLGVDLEWPVMLSPTGASKMFHHTGEPAIARAAAKSGTLYSLSTLSNCSLEEVAASSAGPKVFQLYIFRKRALTASLVERARAAGYKALCLTVDMPVGGNRERDKTTGLVIPPKPSLKSWASFVTRPQWSLDFLRKVKFGFPTFDQELPVEKTAPRSTMHFANTQFDRSVTWRDVEWLAKAWNGPLAVKGILSARDARAAREAGATAIMISNHGGRQMDSVPAPMDVVSEIRAEVGRGLEIILDGGVRRGSHVLKALAAGADVCSIGRAHLYGLAAAGEAGVDRALSLLRMEIERDMALMGAPAVSSLGARHLRRHGSGEHRMGDISR